MVSFKKSNHFVRKITKNQRVNLPPASINLEAHEGTLRSSRTSKQVLTRTFVSLYLKVLEKKVLHHEFTLCFKRLMQKEFPPHPARPQKTTCRDGLLHT